MSFRWNCKLQKEVEAPDIDAFLADVEAVCRKHNLSIGHEDGHGAFEVEALDEFNIKWLKNAHDNR